MLFIFQASNPFQNLKKRKYKKKELLETKWTSKCKKKTQRSSSKIVTSEAFQRVTDETLQESHLKFGKSLASRMKHKIFKLKKKKKWKAQNYGRQNKLSKTKNRNVLASKLRPVKDFKWWTMTLYRSYVKSGNCLAPYNWSLYQSLY